MGKSARLLKQCRGHVGLSGLIYSCCNTCTTSAEFGVIQEHSRMQRLSLLCQPSLSFLIGVLVACMHTKPRRCCADLPESSNRVPEVSGQHHQFQEESRDFLGNLVNPTQIFDYSPWPPQAWITLLQFDEELYFWHVLWDTLRQKWGHEPWSQYKTARPTEYTLPVHHECAGTLNSASEGDCTPDVCDSMPGIMTKLSDLEVSLLSLVTSCIS